MQTKKSKTLSTSLKYLVVAMAMSSTSVTIADVNKKEIGDLEIYKSAQGGSVTIAMMLDTSGSMLGVDLPKSIGKNGIPESNQVHQHRMVALTVFIILNQMFSQVGLKLTKLLKQKSMK